MNLEVTESSLAVSKGDVSIALEQKQLPDASSSSPSVDVEVATDCLKGDPTKGLVPNSLDAVNSFINSYAEVKNEVPLRIICLAEVVVEKTQVIDSKNRILASCSERKKDLVIHMCQQITKRNPSLVFENLEKNIDISVSLTKGNFAINARSRCFSCLSCFGSYSKETGYSLQVGSIGITGKI